MALTQITTGGLDDNVNIGSNTLKVDGTNNRVGIGTAAPSQQLHIASANSSSSGTIIASDSQGRGVLIESPYIGNSVGKIGISGTDSALAFGSGSSNSERLRIDSSGKVGIGTTSPGAALDVVGNSTMLRLYDGTNTSTGKISQSSDVITLSQAGTSSGALAFATGSGALGTERMRIDSSGRVGIGTTSPSDYDLGADDLVVANSGNGGVSIITGTSSVGALYFGDGTSSNQPYRGRVEYKHAEDSLNFGSAGTLHATLDSSGRLLVGASSSRGGNFNNGAGVDSHFLLEGTSFVTSFANIVRNSNDANSAGFALSKSRGTSVGSNTIVQNNDKLGEFAFQGSDGAKLVAAAAIECQVDGTPGTSDMPGRLVFETTADGASSSTERMRITSNTDGQLLLGTTSGSNSSSTGVKLKGGSASSVDVVINAASNINLNHVYNVNATNNGYRFYIQANGGIVNHSGNNTNLSDEREKKNIADMDSAWSDLKQWVLREFHFNDEDDSDPKHYGVIAQQVETVSPEVISDFQKDETTTRKGVKEMQMMWMAIKALQEAQARIETLETKVAALEAAE